MDERLRFRARLAMAGVMGPVHPASLGLPTLDVQVLSTVDSLRPEVDPGSRRSTRAADKTTLGVLDVDALTGWWLVTMQVGKRPGRIFHRLVTVLQSLETRQLHAGAEADTNLDSDADDPAGYHHEALTRMGVHSARQLTRGRTGKIRIATRSSEPDLNPGAVLSAWAGKYLQDNYQHDAPVWYGNPERHAYIHIHFGGAPPEAETLLADISPDDHDPPIPAPELPYGITHLWIATTYSAHGYRWDTTTWQTFPTDS